MILTHINPAFLDTVWPDVSQLLGTAIAKNHGEADLGQVRAQIAFGGAQLLVWEGDHPVESVCVVEFKQHANFRSALVAYLAGKTSEEFWSEFKGWAKQHGASQVECLCDRGQEKIFHRYGMETVYRLMRIRL